MRGSPWRQEEKSSDGSLSSARRSDHGSARRLIVESVIGLSPMVHRATSRKEPSTRPGASALGVRMSTMVPESTSSPVFGSW